VSLALLFSPQGSQGVGMGRSLAEHSAAARSIFDRADSALGWSVSGLCWDGPPERLNDTRQTQASLLTTSVAAMEALREALAARGTALRPLRVAGHSVGEYAALVAAGVLAFEDALRLVARRGELMAAAAVDGGMSAVIGLERMAIASAISAVDGVVIANDNAPGQVVISGTREGLARAGAALEGAGARRLIPLNVSGPFHSPLMADVGRELASAFAGVGWRDAEPPVVSNVTAAPVTAADEIRDLLARQVSSPVEWVRSVRVMAADGVRTFVECGPGAALSGMVRRILPDATTFSLAEAEQVERAAGALVGAGAVAEASV